MRWLIAVPAFLLAACVGTEKVNTFHAICLPLKEYTAAEQQEAASELSRMPKSAEIPKMIVDYGELRSADRECMKHQ